VSDLVLVNGKQLQHTANEQLNIVTLNETTTHSLVHCFANVDYRLDEMVKIFE
jgi:hypothetical protein